MATRTQKPEFVVCVSNVGADDLMPWKLYRVLKDASAAADGYMRVVDESGEDYLYPENRFVLLDLPPIARKQLMSGSH